jgi:hypothetical protein
VYKVVDLLHLCRACADGKAFILTTVKGMDTSSLRLERKSIYMQDMSL